MLKGIQQKKKGAGIPGVAEKIAKSRRSNKIISVTKDNKEVCINSLPKESGARKTNKKTNTGVHLKR